MPLLHDYDVRMPSLSRFMEDVNKRHEIFFVFLNLDIVLRNSTPEGFAFIWQKLTKFDKVLKLVGIIEIEIEKKRIHFLARFSASKGVEIL